MDKKKSSNFIIPATFFRLNSPKEKNEIKKDTVKGSASDNKQPSAVQTVKKEVESIPIRRTQVNRRKSALSLKREKLTDKDFVQTEDLSKKPRDKFTESQLIEKWQSFGAKMKSEGDLNTASVINVNDPVLQDGQILFTLPTKLMEDQLGSVKPKLLRFLRSSLNNYGIQIQTKVDKTQKKKLIYTREDKFQKLAEENPDVLLLKNTFGLDI